MSNRVQVNIRLNPAQLDDLARETNTNRTQVVRAALAVAFNHKKELLNMLNPTGRGYISR